MQWRVRFACLALCAAWLGACFPIASQDDDDDGGGAPGEVGCFGGVPSCYAQKDIESCVWISGCDWNHYWDDCEGEQKACPELDVKDHCLAQPGCSWQNPDGSVDDAMGPWTETPTPGPGASGSGGGLGGGGGPGVPPGGMGGAPGMGGSPGMGGAGGNP